MADQRSARRRANGRRSSWWLGLDRSALAHAVERRARRDRRLIEKYLRDHPVVRVLAPSVVHLGRCNSWVKAVADPNVETAILEARRSLRDEGGRWKVGNLGAFKDGGLSQQVRRSIVEGPELAELTGAIASDLGGRRRTEHVEAGMHPGCRLQDAFAPAQCRARVGGERCIDQ